MLQNEEEKRVACPVQEEKNNKGRNNRKKDKDFF